MPFKKVPPLYWVWRSMRDRCLNPNFRQWADYGGRGIQVCPEWNSFDQFIKDMWPRPSSQHSLDRIDNNSDYSPSNCRWATRKEQQRNQRRAVFVTIEGKRHRAIELAEKYSLKTDTIVSRAKAGLSFDLVTSSRKVLNFHSWKLAVAVRVANQIAKTHCKHGHEYNPENTGINKQGHRFCRHCHRLKVARQNERKRAAS